MSNYIRKLGVTVLALGVLAVAASSAGAATISYSSGTYVYTAASGETNVLNYIAYGGRALIFDEYEAESTATVTVDASAAAVGCVDRGGSVYCPISKRYPVQIDAGDGDDSIALLVSLGYDNADSISSNVVNLGAGSDTYQSTSSWSTPLNTTADTVSGGAGADTIDTGQGTDTVRVASGGTDTVVCGDGFDSYTASGSDSVDTSCEFGGMRL